MTAIKDTIHKYMLLGLDDYRMTIDQLDTALMNLLVERVHLIIQIGAYKLKQRLPLNRSEDRQADLKRILQLAEEYQLNLDFMQIFYDVIYEYSLSIMHYMQEHTEKMGSYQSDFIARDMSAYRIQMRELDMAICNIVAYRLDIVDRVGQYKQERKIPPMDQSRWQQVIEHKKSLARDHDISEDYIERLFDLIHAEALRIES